LEVDIFGNVTPTYITPKSQTNPAMDNVSARKKEAAEPSVIDEIREKGFSAYVKEIQVKKMEELREKILEAMGLSEEELEEMPAKQRNQIEEVIAEEIRRRMMANSTVNSDIPISDVGQSDNAAAKSNIQNSMNTGLVLLQAVEQSSAADPTPKKDETR